MATIFPLSASVGQIYQGYSYNGTAWEIIGEDWKPNTYSPTPPDYAEAGFIWIDSDEDVPEIDVASFVTASNYVVLTNKTINGSNNTLSNIPQNAITDLSTTLSSKQDVVSGVSNTEIGYLDGVTSGIQSQLDSKLSSNSASTTYLTQASASSTYATVSYVDTQTAEFSQNNQNGTSYTFVLADADKIVTSSASAAVTFTIPPSASVAWVDNTILRVANYGLGTLSIAGGSGVTVTNASSTLSQYQSGVIVRTSQNAWTFIPFAGGASPLSDSSVTGTTGSPTTGTFTSGGVNYKFYRFTGTGTITLSKAGLVDILLVGGGGGGGNVYGGGGGAGGHVYKTDYYLPSGSTTITIGAGGSVNGRGGDTIVTSLVAVGGGNGCTGGGASVTNFGGSSGGNSDTSPNAGSGVAGQGYQGGWGAGYGRGGGGGGAGGIGGDGSGPGGTGVYTALSNSSQTGQLSSGNYYLAGGGGGNGNDSLGTGAGGLGGGGQGAWDWNPQASVAGTANTGGGGGGGTDARGGSAGGSGVVVIRVKA